MSIGVLSDTSLHERVRKFIADNEGYRIALVTVRPHVYEQAFQMETAIYRAVERG
jgi:hypothetical protein